MTSQEISLERGTMTKAYMLLAASAAALALTVAGCGGSGDSKSSSSGSNSNSNATLEQAVKYAQCMRKNGVTNWPDPDKDGRFVIGAGGPDRNAPQFKKAQRTCKSQEPPGLHKDTPAERAREQNEWLKVAQCMRKNGVPNFPDPQDGRLKIDRSKINVNSPQFKNAQKACRDAGHPGGGSDNGRG
jgi:hypothetical protein